MSHVEIGRYSKRMIQLLWDPEPLNDDLSKAPIWCLGRKYECDTAETILDLDKQIRMPRNNMKRPCVESNDSTPTPPISSTGTSKDVEDIASPHGFHNSRWGSSDSEVWPKAFLDDFESRIRCTYRSNFPPIRKATDPRASAGMTLSVRLKSQLIHHTGFTSDTGWGCMIRSGQSLLANALAISRRPIDQNFSRDILQEKEVLSWFIDDPKAPFSIHRFVEHGEMACATFPGQWFGPSATAKCIQALANSFAAANLKVYVTGDGPDVFEDALLQMSRSGTQEFTPTLLLVGTRLGIERVTPVYWDALKESLRMAQSLGIAGGRPSSSHYFIGTQGSYFFYLDPHLTQPALSYKDPEALSQDDVVSYHTRRLRRMSIEELDPSMLIAFLFREKSEWLAWKEKVQNASYKAIFHIADSAPMNHRHTELQTDLTLDVETLDDENEID